MRSPAFVRKRPSGASVADAKGIGAESAFWGLSAYAAELVLTLFVFFTCTNSSWNSSPPKGGGTSFPSSRAALFFLVPRTSFPSFPSSRFSAVLGRRARTWSGPSPESCQPPALSTVAAAAPRLTLSASCTYQELPLPRREPATIAVKIRDTRALKLHDPDTELLSELVIRVHFIFHLRELVS